MRRLVATTLALCFLLLPSVGAQGVLEPARERVDAKVVAARSDPVAFAESHASPGALKHEAWWTQAYACFVLDQARRDYGTPRPELEQCDEYEEALGIEEEETPVAQATNLTSDPAAEALDLAQDAVATGQRIAEEPDTVWDELGGFLRRTGDSAKRIIDYLVDSLVAALGAATGAAVGLALSTAEAVDVVGVASMSAAGAASGALTISSHMVEALGASALEAGSTIGNLAAVAIADATGAIGDAIGSVGDAIADTVAAIWESLVGTGDDGEPSQGVDLGVQGPDAEALPCVACLLDALP